MKSAQFFRDRKKIKSWSDFLETIEDASTALRKGIEQDAELWFRGHSSHAYTLLPSLFRHFPDLKGANRKEKLWEVESDLFWEFWARGRELHGVIEDDWDILFAMQHYQTPTRLLDWSEILGVALYFATLNVDDKYQLELRARADKERKVERVRELEKQMRPHPSIWLLNPYALNRRSVWRDQKKDPGRHDLTVPENLGWRWAKGKRPIPSGEYWTYSDLLQEGKMDWNFPRAIYPRQRNPRIHAQRAWFTIHGNDVSPIEALPHRKTYVLEVPLPYELVGDARQFLEASGIDHYLLFADLPSLSLHLQEKNGLITRSVVQQKVAAGLRFKRGG